MDCVTCILMGMCLLCGPGFGGSDQQTSEHTGSTTRGRPMTKEEFSQNLESMLANMNIDIAKPESPPPVPLVQGLSRFTDHRYSRLGIGKKNRQLDAFGFAGGIGKRRARNNLQQILQGSSNHGAKSPTSPEESIDSSLLSWSAMPAIPNFSTDLSKYIFNHMMERAKVLRTQEFLDNERKKLQARRVRHGFDPFMSAMGIGR